MWPRQCVRSPYIGSYNPDNLRFDRNNFELKENISYLCLNIHCCEHENIIFGNIAFCLDCSLCAVAFSKGGKL